MKKNKRTLKDIDGLKDKPDVVERLLNKIRKKGIQFPCPPGCGWLVLKHLFLQQLSA